MFNPSAWTTSVEIVLTVSNMSTTIVTMVPSKQLRSMAKGCGVVSSERSHPVIPLSRMQNMPPRCNGQGFTRR